ncbi:MAG TPA: S4 domain-containing protein [Gemmatimonadaceae bacterium]|jgi:ribosome-associated heat shock protein Hsp15|nr:S4 domain-containing protein [Gemmatimonadaceae bacterium]
MTAPGQEPVRLDIWLWAARFYKTRSLATQAIELGRVLVAGERAKRSRQVRVGDTIVVRHPPFERAVIVRGTSDSRGPATVAAELYEETPESRAARDKLAAQMRAMGPSAVRTEAGRPTKKERRDLDRWKRSR